MRFRRYAALLVMLLAPLVLAACAPVGGEPANDTPASSTQTDTTPASNTEVSSEPTTLVYANLSQWGVNREYVDKFNRSHSDVQIEVRDYLDDENSSGRSGKERLFADIAAGKAPDIIDLGQDPNYSRKLPYEAMARKGVLEDLWPYIENDPDLGREGVVEAPLKAAEVDGKLCVIFDMVYIHTLVGAESIVGNRNSWTLQEMRDTFANMPEGSTLMGSTLSKSDMFRYVFSMNTDGYIDWETGECSFDSEEFRSALEFLNTFPAEIDLTRFEELLDEDMQRLLNGKQVVSSMCSIYLPRQIQFYDNYYGLGGQASFVGYPVEDGTPGSSFSVPMKGQKLAMSATCQNKEAAWEFMRQLILPRFKDVDAVGDPNALEHLNIRINRSDFDLIKQYEMSKLNGGTAGYNNAPTMKYHNATKEEVQRFEDFINSVDKIEFYDNTVYDIIYENATAYFSGDKTLDETVDLIQRRVSLYVNEMR